MRETPLHEWSIADAGRALRDGTLTATELVEDALQRIRVLDPTINAFVHLDAARAYAAAGRADRELAAGVDRGPLHGIPYALKDIFDVAGIPTSCHSHLMRDHVAAEDSTVVTRLLDGGAVLLGKLATHEFALGGPSPELPFPPARNPWDTERFTGGSSSGSAAAVAAGLTRLALGSDTSGSIRGPASYCGVVGFKPTYGRVSRRGVFPLSYALDHCGPLTWTVEDAAIALQVLAGHDPADVASAVQPVPDYRAGLGEGVRGMRIAFPRRFWSEMAATTDEVLADLDRVGETFAALGADLVEVDLPPFDWFSACGRLLMTAEGYAIHERMLRTRGAEYGRYTYQRLLPGAAISAADLVHAHRLRLQLSATLERDVFRHCHAMISGGCLSPAPRLDAFPRDWPPTDASKLTIPFNVTGHPALAMPSGFDRAGMPLGFQIVGRAFDEASVLRIGHAYQCAMGYPDRRPPGCGASPTGASPTGPVS
jgi:aspartyl-tRNA(Asn)/glutamyl-tRNA(Gln) amidotransferase subunit A